MPGEALALCRRCGRAFPRGRRARGRARRVSVPIRDSRWNLRGPRAFLVGRGHAGQPGPHPTDPCHRSGSPHNESPTLLGGWAGPWGLSAPRLSLVAVSRILPTHPCEESCHILVIVQASRRSALRATECLPEHAQCIHRRVLHDDLVSVLHQNETVPGLDPESVADVLRDRDLPLGEDLGGLNDRCAHGQRLVGKVGIDDSGPPRRQPGGWPTTAGHIPIPSRSCEARPSGRSSEVSPPNRRDPVLVVRRMG